jgi:small subunit ribosomal protein S16
MRRRPFVESWRTFAVALRPRAAAPQLTNRAHAQRAGRRLAPHTNPHPHSMAVVIRMRRTGRRNRPCYRINVADSRSPRDGRFLETLGQYDPVSKDEEKQVTLNVERAKHWLSVGALPSDTVNSIFKRSGVYEGQAPAKPRRRTGRGQSTKTREAKQTAKKARAERKGERRSARVVVAKAAKAAAATAAAAEADGGEE